MLIQEICRECSFLHLQDMDTNSDIQEAIRKTNGHINVLVDTGHLFQSHLELFFGPQPENEEVFVVVPADATWAQVLAGLGCFPSVSQARNNGWNKLIEDGFTPTFKVGKAHRKFITAFKPTDSEGTEGKKIEHGVVDA
jgi:hypothetical protein